MQKHVSAKYPSVKAITDEERIGMVREIFSTITGRYDFLNHFLSLGIDMGWRRFAVKKMNFFTTKGFLDVACGTGDLSIGAARKYPEISVTGLDFVSEMVKTGRRKTAKKNLAGRVFLAQGDALNLPFPDNSFDVAAIAFGIRNIPDKKRALQEMLRVVVPGGQVMVLEMTFIRKGLLKFPYYVYLNFLLPIMARFFSSNPAAYHYLADSIMNFPSPVEFADFMSTCRMKNVEIHPLTFGAACLHIGHKNMGDS